MRTSGKTVAPGVRSRYLLPIQPHRCSIVPPHILRNIAAHDDDARAALDVSADLREERELAVAAKAARAEGKRRRVYDARGERTKGRLVRAEGDDAVDDVAVNEAYDGAGRTYDFFRKIHGRDSIDGRGMRIDSTVHYGRRFDNAQWTGRQLVYGDGDGRYFRCFTKSLDVIAHELTHGVIQHSAVLGYRGEPGALNEHFADVFGVLVTQHAKRQSAAKADWLIGAGLLMEGVHGEAIRSMKAPGTAYDDPILGRDPQPAHMRDFLDTKADSGGVHVNSGIPNHAFYRAAIALGGNAWSVAGKIWYRALTEKLASDATFQQGADAAYAIACEFGDEPREAVLAAWKAVGINVSAATIDAGARLRVRARRAVAREPVDVPTAAAEVPNGLWIG